MARYDYVNKRITHEDIRRLTADLAAALGGLHVDRTLHGARIEPAAFAVRPTYSIEINVDSKSLSTVHGTVPAHVARTVADHPNPLIPQSLRRKLRKLAAQDGQEG